MKIIKKKNKGILFWITGLSGSGKTSLANRIIKTVTKKYGPSIAISGDDLRKILNFHGYSKKERTELCYKTSEIINYNLMSMGYLQASIFLIPLLRILLTVLHLTEYNLISYPRHKIRLYNYDNPLFLQGLA